MYKNLIVILTTITLIVLTLSSFRSEDNNAKSTTMRNIDSSNVIKNDALTENHFTVNEKKMKSYMKCFEGTNSSVLYNGNAILSDSNELRQGNNQLKSYILAYSLPVYMTYRVQNGVIVNYSTLSFEEEDTRLQTIEKLFKEENVNLTIQNLKSISATLDAGEEDVIYRDKHRYVTLAKIDKSYRLIAIITSEDNTEYDDKIYVTEMSYQTLLDDIIKGMQEVVKDYESSFEFKTSSSTKFGYYTIIDMDSKNKLAYRIDAPNLEESNKLYIELQVKGDKKKLKLITDSFLNTLDKTLINNITYEDLISTSRTIEELNLYIDKAFSDENSNINAELINRMKGINNHYNKLNPYAYKLNLTENKGRYIISFEANLFKVKTDEGGI